MKRTGSCLCGEATVEAEPMPSMQACHCSMCRQWTAGPFMSVPCQLASFSGPIGQYASSEGDVRGICKTCGSSLYFHPSEVSVHAIPISLFDDQSDLPFRAEIFIDDKPDYYEFANPTKKMTGAEFMNKFRAKRER